MDAPGLFLENVCYLMEFLFSPRVALPPLALPLLASPLLSLRTDITSLCDLGYIVNRAISPLKFATSLKV